MDERYYLVKGCMRDLKTADLPAKKRLQLETALLQLRIQLIKCPEAVKDARSRIPYERLNSLLQRLSSHDGSEVSFNEIAKHIDALLSSAQEEVLLAGSPRSLNRVCAFASETSGDQTKPRQHS